MVTAGQINLDFIMDERERELAGEFTRWYDLVRPGAQFFVDRVKKYNPHGGANVQLKHALRPIPQSQIDGVVVGPKISSESGILRRVGTTRKIPPEASRAPAGRLHNNTVAAICSLCQDRSRRRETPSE
jgi:hypothetical protein